MNRGAIPGAGQAAKGRSESYTTQDAKTTARGQAPLPTYLATTLVRRADQMKLAGSVACSSPVHQTSSGAAIAKNTVVASSIVGEARREAVPQSQIDIPAVGRHDDLPRVGAIQAHVDVEAAVVVDLACGWVSGPIRKCP